MTGPLKKYQLLLPLLLFFNGLQAQSFTNPILAGFYPDPSICRAGDDYYLVNSSFAYYPGLPLFHSKDLLNWKQIGHAMDRPRQLDLEGAGVSRGLFAPAISYHNGIFYIVCTEVSRLGNFVITARDPKGPWSDPVQLPQVNGIDPSLFFDHDGRSYIVYNSIPPDNKSLWNGHRTIRLYEFDAATLKVKGEEQLMVNGGTDTSKHPVWIEGPHLYQKDGWYYLMCAEGGTGYQHSEVVFRSRTIKGPWIPYENNPILTQRHLDTTRAFPITTTGHADLVEDQQGNWWAVFLGCRPYQGDHYNTGRETFMAPVQWKNGWPHILEGNQTVAYSYPIAATREKGMEAFNGNQLRRDEFTDTLLANRYCFLRTVKEKWYQLNPSAGMLSLQLRPETCSGKFNPSFIGWRQSHLRGYTATAMRFTAANEKEKAGLLAFQNEKHYYYLCQSLESGKQVLQLFQADSLLTTVTLPSLKSNTVYLKLIAEDSQYTFWYATRKGQWKQIGTALDARFLSTKTAGGFVGVIYALYASSNGNSSVNRAEFDWWELKNDDTVYKQ